MKGLPKVDPAFADSFVRRALELAKSELDATGREGKDLRERDHVDPAVKRACEQLTGGPVSGKELETAHFSGIGSVDVCVVDPAGPDRSEMVLRRKSKQDL